LTKTWPNAKIFFVPIIRRKDISYDKVKHANSYYCIRVQQIPHKFTYRELWTIRWYVSRFSTLKQQKGDTCCS
jgi:hypothetical protein